MKMSLLAQTVDYCSVRAATQSYQPNMVFTVHLYNINISMCSGNSLLRLWICRLIGPRVFCSCICPENDTLSHKASQIVSPERFYRINQSAKTVWQNRQIFVLSCKNFSLSDSCPATLFNHQILIIDIFVFIFFLNFILNVGPDLAPNCLTLWWYTLKIVFWRKKLIRRWQKKKHANLPSMQRSS